MSSEKPVTRSESLHNQVARNIRNDIEAGLLRDGDVLPSTRELAAQWNVSVFTISEAMKVLAEEGLVISKSRSKRMVQAPSAVQHDRSHQPTSPTVVLIGGFAGSGKTELGRILARMTGWAILDKDTLTRPVVESVLEILGQSPNDRESEQYLSVVRPREYEALAAATVENVTCGNSAIVTAPFIREFSDERWISRIRAQYAEMNATTVVVWVYCDALTMHTYIRHRGAGRDTAKMADWPGYLDTVNIDLRPVGPHVVIDNRSTGIPLQMQAQDLLKSIVAGDFS